MSKHFIDIEIPHYSQFEYQMDQWDSLKGVPLRGLGTYVLPKLFLELFQFDSSQSIRLNW